MYIDDYYKLIFLGGAAYIGVHPSLFGLAAYSDVHPSLKLIKTCTLLFINVPASSWHSASCPLVASTFEHRDQNRDVQLCTSMITTSCFFWGGRRTSLYIQVYLGWRRTAVYIRP
jgi:hypothetical protein